VKNKLVKLLKIFILSGGFIGQACLAADNWICSPYSGNPSSRSFDINATTYVGNEMPVGSIIYRFEIFTDPVGVICSSSMGGNYTYQGFLTIANEPSGPSFTFNGTSFGSGQVYPTNVSGVGVVITSIGSETTISSTTPYLARTNSYISGGGMSGGVSFGISLIKTGPITSGSQVKASSFPTVTFMIPAQAGYSGFPVTLNTINFSGSVNFTTSTCTTPDVNVDMGTHDVADTFHGIGTTTPWVDSSIILQDCPTFSGYYNESMYQEGYAFQSSAPGVTTVTGNDRTANIMTVSLTPTTSIIDAANGVIAVNNTGSSGQAATGVGLQLGYTPNNYAASATSPTTIWTSGAMWNISPPSSGLGNFKIPLAARYYQTSNTVTAGPANAKVTFNIDYK
jgi:major type 1 subunit fimbrin (pilin)